MGKRLFDLAPLDASFGAVVSNIDLRSLNQTTWQMLFDAWIEYALLIFPGQHLTRDEQNTFAQRFGVLEFPAAPISNIATNGDILSDPESDTVKSLRGNEGWHHDSTYMPVQAKGAVFSAEIVPSRGAATGWADMRAAYDALDADMRNRLAELRAFHSLYYSQGRAGYLPAKKADGTYGMYGYHDKAVSLRPLVKAHPVSGRMHLLIGRHAHDIEGMAPGESELLLDRLNDEACRPPRLYYHQWQPGDVVVWDNRSLMHRATPFDMREPRRMWHTRIAGDTTERALNHA
ncbi:MAG: TauD/TfdA family dioxygenase [Pseudomonadales bacterium]